MQSEPTHRIYEIRFRYVGQSLTAADAEHAMQTCETVRQAVRAELRLPIEENKDNP